MAAAQGELYVCGTPIGNLEDITLRVLRVLKEVSLIAAEDTRHTRKLLAHFGIDTPVVSLHEHNEAQRVPQIIERLLGGESVALVSDAGMPVIQDPGQGLVRAAVDAGIQVTVVPGPTALATALAGAGLATERFAFEGFLPREARRRRAHLEAVKEDPRTLVFYEAPHRLRAALADMLAVLGDRQACIARELTKVHEEWQRDRLSGLVREWAERTPQGEFVIVVAGAPQGAEKTGSGANEAGLDEREIRERLRAHMRAGADKKAAVRAVAAELGLPRRTVYQAAMALPAPSASPGTDAPPGDRARDS
ncbi:MAG: 16S rRNA (cytidine(1402)-2'-O)-methyltransferase [Firmicutes bacterium ZCTH02-B6]|nr:MAG: 16S rRNA (cytidine(1402)-2'-O)-methyltransferase [Firmicutes bacterium ZCTH02-B6]